MNRVGHALALPTLNCIRHHFASRPRDTAPGNLLVRTSARTYTALRRGRRLAVEVSCSTTTARNSSTFTVLQSKFSFLPSVQLRRRIASRSETNAGTVPTLACDSKLTTMQSTTEIFLSRILLLPAALPLHRQARPQHIDADIARIQGPLHKTFDMTLDAAHANEELRADRQHRPSEMKRMPVCVISGYAAR